MAVDRDIMADAWCVPTFCSDMGCINGGGRFVDEAEGRMRVLASEENVSCVRGCGSEKMSMISLSFPTESVYYEMPLSFAGVPSHSEAQDIDSRKTDSSNCSRSNSTERYPIVNLHRARELLLLVILHVSF